MSKLIWHCICGLSFVLFIFSTIELVRSFYKADFVYLFGTVYGCSGFCTRGRLWLDIDYYRYNPVLMDTTVDPGWGIETVEPGDPELTSRRLSLADVSFRFGGFVYWVGQSFTEYCHCISVPLWYISIITGILPIRWEYVRRRRSIRNRENRCQKCGYDLRASPDRCPECGTVPIDIQTGR